MIYIFLILLVLNSWYIYGLWFASKFDYRNDTQFAIDQKNAKFSDVDMDSANPLWKIRFYSFKYFGEKRSKFIIACPPCMSWLHSFYIYFTVRPLQSQGIFIEIVAYIGYVFALCGLNYMFIKD